MQPIEYYCPWIKKFLLTAVRHSAHRGGGGGGGDGRSWGILSLASTGHLSETRPTATVLRLFPILFFFQLVLSPLFSHMHIPTTWHNLCFCILNCRDPWWYPCLALWCLLISVFHFFPFLSHCPPGILTLDTSCSSSPPPHTHSSLQGFDIKPHPAQQ